MNPYLLDKVGQGQLAELEVEVNYSTEWDEFWSYVQKKDNPRWTWYIVERSSGRIVGWENGRRQDEVLRTLLKRVEGLPIKVCCTDGLGAYQRCLPEEYVHIVGKDRTWKIERKKGTGLPAKLQDTPQEAEQENDMLFQKGRDT